MIPSIPGKSSTTRDGVEFAFGQQATAVRSNGTRRLASRANASHMGFTQTRRNQEMHRLPRRSRLVVREN